MTPHINSKQDQISNIVLMPGDPLRAKYIAENFLEDYKLVNSVRNMFAYTGTYKGKPVTIFSSGMGNPSMGIYSHELFEEYDVEEIIRVGSCGAFKEDLGLYEVLLVDNDHNVTEGSKSNTFFVKGNTIVTAMAQDVLCGITRLQIVSLIHSLRIPLEERKIHLSELSDFDAAFISGTSPKVLPIRSVESIEYKVDNPIVQKLSEAYNKSISNYIESYKKRKQ